MELPRSLSYTCIVLVDTPAAPGSWVCIWRQFCKIFSNRCSSPPHSLFANTEDEYIPDAESVRLQRERHHQPQTCTLSQCFQLYTKEERVRGAAGAGGGRGAAERQRVPGAPGLGADAGSAGMAGSAPSPRTLSARVFKCLEKVDDGLKCSRNEPL